MNLQTTPFLDSEKKKKYELISFEELGVKINLLNEVSTINHKLPSGNMYRFGVIIEDNYYWYFNGQPVKSVQGQKVDRKKMREIYSLLTQINKSTNNIPFVYKQKR